METCDGKTHSGSDDSYSQWSYPCPGPEKCADAARREQEATAQALAAEDGKVTPEDLKSVFGYDEKEEKIRAAERLVKLEEEREAARVEAVERLKGERDKLVRARGEEEAGYMPKWEPGSTQTVIRDVCDGIRDFLLDKNAQYGDSAIDPVRIFSKASPIEQLLVRIDDKLSRIEKGDDRIESDDDVIDDLIGYFILLKVAKVKGLS